MKKVAVVTVNFNGKSDTFELLSSLKQLSTANCHLSTIVVDNGSSDGFVEEASKKHPEVEILQTGMNKGFTGGFNRGIEHALIWGADYVLIINNDATINSPELLQKLIKTAESEEKVGVVAPKIYFEKGFEFHKDKYNEEHLGKVIWYAGGEFDWANVQSKHTGIDEVDLGQYDSPKEVDFITGCCMLIKREVLEKVGMFGDEFFAYFEDADFCKRVKASGFKLFYNGTVSIFHKVSRTEGVGSKAADYYGTRNRLEFGARYSKDRTKFALIRQGLGFLVSGREYQRKGVIDFLKGKMGPMSEQKQNEDAQYPVTLSIVSVNYNTPDLIDGLLKSIYTLHPVPSTLTYEVIILDNGSEKGCADVVKKYPGVRFIQNEVNTGFTGGNNKAIKYSRGKYILMLNSDIEVTEGALEQIVEEAEKYKQSLPSKDGRDNAVFSGALYFPDGTLQDSVFYLPTITGALKEYFLGLKGSFFMYAPKNEKNTRVEGAAMACFLIPRKILNKIGFLDERLFTYFEDVDYCRRLKKMDIPVYYTPKAKFIHHHGATGKTLKQGKAYALLQRAAKIYYGETYYKALSFVLRVAQKISWVKTPVAR